MDSMNKNTAVKDQVGAFREEMEKIKFDSPEANEAYSFMLQDLHKLVKETDRFYTETDLGSSKVPGRKYQKYIISDINPNAFYPRMDEDSFDQFTRLYQNSFDSMKACREVLSGLPGTEENKEAAILLIDNVQKYLGEDLVLLSSAKEKKLSTLPEIIEQARAQIVNIEGQELSMVGANMSSRRKITVPGKKDGDSVSGFFTESVSSDQETEMNELYERTVRNNPKMKKLIDTIDKIDKEQKGFDMIWENLERTSGTFNTSVNQGGVSPDGDYYTPEHIFDRHLSDYLSEDEKNEFFKKDALMYLFADYLKERAKISNKYSVFEDAGIANNNSLDERNSAMSFVADLLGMDGLIARAEPMILQDKGKKISGTFMHYANGTDASECKIGDPLLRPGAEIDYNSDHLKKQVADLQVLDYICGNTDRHGANMFYQIDDSDPKHPRITGIQGIDNDNSFGTVRGKSGRLPDIEEMMVIREDTARVITGLNEDMLKTTLRNFKLSNEEVQAAWDRTKQLQDAIKDGREFYKNQAPDVLDSNHLRIVKDTELQKFQMNELAKSDDSYFTTVTLAQECAATKYFEKESEKVDKEYREVSVQVYNQKAGINDLSQTLKNNSTFMGSRQYERVMDAVNQLGNLHDGIYQEDFHAGAREVKAAYRQTIKTAEEYLQYKQDELDEKLKGKSESQKQKITEKFLDPNSKNGKRIAAVSMLVSEIKKYEEQLDKMETLKEKSRELAGMKQAKLDVKMSEIEKLMPKQKGERVRMTQEELFGRPRSRSMEVKKAPEEAKNLERRSMNPRSMG